MSRVSVVVKNNFRKTENFIAEISIQVSIAAVGRRLTTNLQPSSLISTQMYLEIILFNDTSNVRSRGTLNEKDPL